MFKKLKARLRLSAMALVVSAAIFGVSSAASAAELTFSTTGVFGGPDLTVSPPNELTSGEYTLSFAGVSFDSGVNGPNAYSGSFGSFTVTGGPDYTPGVFAGDTFTLVISQTNPSTGNSSIDATLTGDMYTTNSGTLSIDFTQIVPGPAATAYINNGDGTADEYAIYTPSNIVNNNISGGVTQISAALIPVTPLPKPAAAGLGLLALLTVGSRFKAARKIVSL
jgi:hypothetical protein